MKSGIDHHLFVDKTGKRYGKLVAVEFSHSRRGVNYWKCICDCGNEKVVSTCNLSDGSNQSCGCAGNAQLKHGKKHTRLYNIWVLMRQRCTNSSHPRFYDYGGIGVVVCEDWIHDFMPFYDWAMSNGYREDLTLDRFPDQQGNYCPSNCRWADWIQQAGNKRNNINLTYNGETKCIGQWARDLGIKPATIYDRKYRGLSDEECLFGRTRKSAAHRTRT